MKSRNGLFALVILATVAADGVVAAPVEIEPYLMVRSLQLVQDRIAVGDHAAMPMQRKLLELIDRRLREASAAELMKPLNLNAMLVYAMSGGNPETLQILARRMHLAEREGRLVAGITSYLNGATKTSALTLGDVEPMREPAEIGAFLALVRGSVISLEDPTSAIGQFDQARLLAPGTLIEEAALRRSVALAAIVGNPTRFLRLSEQYVRGYLRSPYASQFADAFVNGVLALHARLDLAEVDAVVDMMADEQRKVIYLRVARRAAIDGLVDLSNYASRKADGVEGQEAEASDPRVLLYTSLTDITTAPTQEIHDRLARIDRSQLSESDRKLLDAVIAVSGAIVRTPGEGVDAEPAGEAMESPRVVAAPQAPPPHDQGEEAARPEGPQPSPAVVDEDVPEVAQPVDEAAVAEPARQSPAPAPDSTEALLSVGRQRLAEIDALLGEAAE